ncbi:MAG: DUF4331 family protein [Planctomycetaceae bacterium]
MNYKSLSVACFAAVVGLCVLGTARDAMGADHQDSPLVTPNGALDINDLYAFQSPQNPANVVMIMTVNPFAGVMSPTAFSTRGVYEFNVDTDGDAVPNFAYRFYFSPVRQGAQRFVVVERNGKVLVSGITGKTTSIRNGGKVTAGLFDDPFFFDLAGFRNGLMFTGANAFAGVNVSAIVLEVPRSLFPTKDISIYTRTLNGARQFDRNGRPAINTVLIRAGRKDIFNQARPDQDVQLFTSEVVSRLMELGNTQAEATAFAGVLLPDVMTIDTSSAAGFLNGRKLADDVIDAELSLLIKPAGSVTTDLVNANDKPFLNVFPYLAAPFAIAP